MTKTASTNMPILSVDNAVKTLSFAYINSIKKGSQFKNIPSVMLWGAPGVGKSQAIRQIGEKIEEETGKRVSITDVRLLLFNPIDIRGIPVANEDRTLSVWLKPKIFQMDESDDIVNILFLDEISAAPQSVQAAAYQITLDRVVGEHRLPDNCIVIAAGNRVTDKSVAYKMPKALANRLMHIEIEGNFESWRRWAVANGINDKVLGYLSFRNDRLFGFDTSNDDLAFPTPRSWEMVSNILNETDGELMPVYPMIMGLIGSGVAMEFRSWCKNYEALPDIEDIFMGKCIAVPERPDVMYALVSSMTAYASEHKYDINLIGNSLEYARRLPADFVKLLLLNYESFGTNYKQHLMSLPEYIKIAEKRGKAINGHIG